MRVVPMDRMHACILHTYIQKEASLSIGDYAGQDVVLLHFGKLLSPVSIDLTGRHSNQIQRHLQLDSC